MTRRKPKKEDGRFGEGWRLKVLSVKEPEPVFEYLMKHKKRCRGFLFRCAMEKLSGEKRKMLMM